MDKGRLIKRIAVCIAMGKPPTMLGKDSAV